MSSLTNLARQHELLVPVVAATLRRMCANSYIYTAKDAIREFGWFVHGYPAYQEYFVDSLIDYYARFGLLISLRHAQYMDARPDDDAFETLYELDPAIIHSRVSSLARLARESGSERNIRHIAALFVTLDSNIEAAELFEKLAEALPQERRSDRQRHQSYGLAKALRAEAALAEGHVDDARELLGQALEEVVAGRAPERRLPFGLQKSSETVSFYEEWIEIRRQWLKLPSGAQELEDAANAGVERLNQLGDLSLSEREAQTVAMALDILCATCFLAQWVRRVLAGEPASGAARDAAVAHLAQAARIAAELGRQDLTETLAGLSENVSSLGPSSGIDALLESIRSLSLPFPRYDLPIPREWRPRRPRPEEDDETGPRREPSQAAVAVAAMRVDGHPPPNVVTAIANRTYDVEVELDVADAPADATHVTVNPVSSLPVDDYLFPRATMALEPGRRTYSLQGHMRFAHAQSEGSRPLSIKLLASFDSPEAGQVPVELFGQRELQVRVYETDQRFRARSAAAQAAVDRLQVEVGRLVPASQDPHREEELEVAAALSNYMDMQLSEAWFRGQESEDDFEKHLVQYMRIRFDERDDIYRQVYSGGGLIDALILGVPVELKVLREGILESFAEASLPQATEYVVSRGRRVGFLAILDARQRDTPTPPIVDDVSARQGSTEPGLAPTAAGIVAVGIAVIRARVARPSDLKAPYSK